MKRIISGYSLITCTATGEVLKEVDTVNCGHCSRVCHPEVGSIPGDNYGHCTRCDRDICAGCATKMEAGGLCDVWEEKTRRLEAAILRQAELQGWGA